MSNLLDKASILLTPTAYDNGRMLSVKPNENLYGSELVTNGDFATDSNWTKDGGWSIQNGQAICNGVGINSLQQSGVTTTGKTYKLTFDIISKSSDDFLIISTNFGDTYVNGSSTSLGTNTFYITPTSGTGIRFRVANGTSLTIDNVSVVEDLTGDFTFSRSSAATRVNAQGLVENVQIISPELVSNGNFSQIGTEEVLNGNFSQQSSELITNGNFDTDSDWNKGTGWTITNGKASCDGVSSNSNLSTLSPFYSGSIQVKITLSVTDYVSGVLKIFLATSSFTEITANGDYTFYTTADRTDRKLYLKSVNFIGSIDNVSVKEVGQNWVFGTGWSVGEDKAVCDGTNITYLTQTGVLATGTSYRVQFDIVDYTSGSVKYRDNGLVSGQSFSGVGSYTDYVVAGGGQFRLMSENFIGSVTNISVKEVGQDWTFGTGWSVGDGIVEANNTSSFISQSGLIEASKLYRLTFEARLKSGTNGTINAYIGGANNQQFTIANTDWQSFTYEDTRGSSAASSIYFNNNGTELELDNISVKEITDDTDIPRINYEGFSYQDSLGSEEVVNGDFSNGSANWFDPDGAATFSNNSVTINGASGNRRLNQVNVTSPITSQFKLQYEITEKVGTSDLKVYTTNSGSAAYTIVPSTIGVHTFYFTSNLTTFYFNFSNSSGSITIDNVSVKEVVGQEVVPDSGCGSWLLEPQSTNLLTYSEDFSQSVWGHNTDIATTSSLELAPNGELDANLIEYDGGGYSFIRISTSPPSTATTLSVFAKKGNWRYLGFRNFQTSGNDHTVFDFDTETFSNTASGQTASFEIFSNGWYRIKVTQPSPVSTSAFAGFAISNSSGGELNTTDGQVANVHLFGAQLEEQSFSTSYIPTNGASNTRLQDIANNSGNSTLINSTEGVLYAEIAALANDGTNRIIALNKDTNDRIQMFFNTSTNGLSIFYKAQSGATLFVMDETLTDATSFNKIAFKWKANDFALWVNGVETDTVSSGVTPTANSLNALEFEMFNNFSPFYGKTKALAVYKEALTDANLRSLTYPNPVATTFDLDFDTIAEQFTFTRGSEATFVNAQGLIESTASNDAPRIDYSTGAKAFLLEPQSTNIIPYSEDFSDSSWLKTRSTIDLNSTISPSGELNASLLKETATSGSHFLERQINLTAGSHTVSFFVKKYTRRYIQAGMFNSGQNYVIVDLDTNSITSTVGGIISSKIESLENGWIKVSNLITATATTSYPFIATALSATDVSFLGDVNEGVYVWGAQLEQQSYSTSYIPTSGASATRNQELCNNATPVINSEEGTLYAEISALADDLTNRFITLTDTTSNNSVSLFYGGGSSNFIRCEIKSNNVTQAELTTTSYTITNYNKIAISYAENNFALWVNGAKVSTDTSGNTPIGLNDLSFNRADALKFFGNTKDLKYYPKALADVQLEDLTTI